MRSLASIRPSSRALIRWRRPRGDSSSWPVAIYVGHAGKQKPQWMQLLRSSAEGTSDPANAIGNRTDEAPTAEGSAGALTVRPPSDRG